LLAAFGRNQKPPALPVVVYSCKERYHRRLIARIHFRNFFYLSIADGISHVLFLGIVIYLARVLGAEGLGTVTFARSIILYLLLIVNAGLELYGIRAGSRDPRQIPHLIGTFLFLRFFLIILVSCLLVILVFFLPKSAETKQVLLLYGGMLITTGLLLEWPFQAVERMHILAVGRVLAECLFVFVVIGLIHESRDILWVPVGRFLGGAAELILLFLLSRRLFGKIRFEWAPSRWRDILKRSMPMGAGFIMVQVYSNMDNIMLGLIRSEQEVGLYAAAYKIVMAIVLAGVVYHKALYPALSRLSHQSIEKMNRLLVQSARLLVIFAIPVVAASWILAAELISLLYGREYVESIPVFQILIIKVLLMWVNGLTANAVLASDQERRFLVSVTLGALTNLLLNVFFIPHWGMTGAAVATILSECVVFVYFFIVYLSRIRISVMRDLRGLMAAVFSMGMVYILLASLIRQKIVLLIILCFVYFSILCIFKILDFKRILDVIRSR